MIESKGAQTPAEDPRNEKVLIYLNATPFPSLADLFYLLMYLLFAAGMVGLYRLGVVRRDAAGVLDALTLTSGVALVSWVLLIVPYVTNPELTVLEKVISASYPLGDLLVIATGASLVVSMRPTPALRLLAIGGVGLLASDIAYGYIQLHGEWRVGTLVDLGWVAFYLCWGLAALHPSMRQLTEPKLLREREEGAWPGRLVLLGLASLIAPAVLAVEALTTGVQDALAIAVFSAALSTLVLIRLYRAARSQRRSVLRERALRRAGAELLSTTNVDDVSAVVTRAVDRLLPPGRPHRVILDLAEPRAEAGVDRPQVRPDRTDPSTGRAEPDSGPTTVYTADLPAPAAGALGGFEVALRCDVPGHQGQPAGTLYLAADEAVLANLQESAQVLADQTGLTLQRVLLSAEIDRRNSEAYFRTLVLNAADVILILDDADRVRYASPSAAALFEGADLRGEALPELVAQESGPVVRGRLTRIRDGASDEGGPAWRVPRPGAGEALVEARCRDLRGEPTVDGVVVTMRDVTESNRMQAELYRRATTDALTGLPNHDVFVGAVQRAVDEVRGQGRRAGVVTIGLDEFKLVNNTMGHRGGDEVLALGGPRLTEAMRTHDVVRRADGGEWTVARLGSDEFATCLGGVRDQDDIDRAVAAVMSCFTEPFMLGKATVTLRASIGVAMTTGETDASELLRQADLALSVAKDAGRNRMMQYEDSLHALVADRLQLRGDLERAVAEGSFALQFQPIVALPWEGPNADVRTRRTVGFEALVRWQHPERGTLGPGEFIALAEESGLIVPLGHWVLHHSIRTALTWSDWRDGGTAPYVSVNVSARQLRSNDFVGRVLDELAASRLPAERLVLEITESMLVQEGSIKGELARLREHGIRVAIDDFGTGFSSLSYLRELPVDILKLDKSFAETITTSADQKAIIATVTDLAHRLRLQVVAEGIETEQEMGLLAASGCGFGQGYVVSRPITHQDVAGWLRSEADGSGDGHAAASAGDVAEFSRANR